VVTIYVATASGLFSAPGRELLTFEGSEVGGLVAEGDAWWALVDGHEVWRTTGPGWERVSQVPDMRLNCLHPVNGAVLAGTSEAHLVEVVDDARLLESFDGVEERGDWYTPWGGPPDVRSISASEDALFVNVHVGGILRSSDATETWQQTIDIGSDVHQVLAGEDGLVLAATAVGLATSRDGGESWAFDEDGLHASYSRGVAMCDDIALVSACVGPHGGRAALYRRPVTGGIEFEKCADGLPEWFGDNIDTACVDGYGDAAAFGTSDGDVYLSEDAGRSWSRVASGLPPVRAVAIA
jgi:hypothetical protein